MPSEPSCARTAPRRSVGPHPRATCLRQPADLHADRVYVLLQLSDQLDRIEHQLNRFLQCSPGSRSAGTSLLVGSLHGGSPFSFTTGSYDPVKGTAISLFN